MSKVRLFISQRMNGLREEDILSARDSAYQEALTILKDMHIDPADVELIDQFKYSTLAFEQSDIKETSPNRCSVFMLGNSIKLMAEADYVFFMDDVWDSNGCYIEQQVCDLYHIPILNNYRLLKDGMIR